MKHIGAIRMEVDDAVKTALFPKMIVQPLVENAIFHGLETVEAGGEVHVAIWQEDNRLLLTVTDNGCGMTEDELATLRANLQEFDRTNDFPNRKHGIGIINIYRRLRLFYGEKLDFAIHSVSGAGTKVEIRVPSQLNMMEEQNVPGFFD